MGIKSAFRHVGNVLGGARAFAFRLQDLIFVDLRLPFGWCESLGWSEVPASALQEALRTTNGRRRSKAVTSHVDIVGTIGETMGQAPGAKGASW